jgi:putative addiction module component (TIGR02574 family)
MDSKQILLEALRLSDEERAAIAGELIESLDPEVDADAEAAWSAEIHRRVEELKAGRAETVPWAEARRRIRLAAQSGARS